MKVQLANPITMSTKWEDRNIFNFPEASTLEEAACMAVRQRHEFLTDDNHIMSAGGDELTWGGKLNKFNAVTVYRNEVSEVESPYRGPLAFVTDYWFAVEYRSVDTNP